MLSSQDFDNFISLFFIYSREIITNTNNYLNNFFHNFAACFTLFLMKPGNNGWIKVPSHNFPGIYKSFCPFLIPAIILYAVFSADYCLFVEVWETCFDPKISLLRIGVSKLVGYTINMDMLSS